MLAGAGLPVGGAVELGAVVLAGGGAVVLIGGAEVVTGGVVFITGTEVVGDGEAEEQPARIRLEISRIPSITQSNLFIELPPLVHFHD
jgi:hypothetical protein